MDRACHKMWRHRRVNKERQIVRRKPSTTRNNGFETQPLCQSRALLAAAPTLKRASFKALAIVDASRVSGLQVCIVRIEFHQVAAQFPLRKRKITAFSSPGAQAAHSKPRELRTSWQMFREFKAHTDTCAVSLPLFPLTGSAATTKCSLVDVP